MYVVWALQLASISVAVTEWFVPPNCFRKKPQCKSLSKQRDEQPLQSWEGIQLAQKISLLLMQTEDRLPAQQWVRLNNVQNPETPG